MREILPWTWKVVVASTHSHSLLLWSTKLGKTQPWIKGREAKVKLSRKDKHHLCIWVALIATLYLNLCILYIIYVPTVSNYKCFHILEAFCISFSENRVHSLCLFFYWFVCFFSCIYRHYQGNWPFDVWIANIFHCLCMGVLLIRTTNKSIPGSL